MKEKIVLTFGINDIIRIKQILVDEDKEEAFKFIKESFTEAIRNAEYSCCELLIPKAKINETVEGLKKRGACCGSKC